MQLRRLQSHLAVRCVTRPTQVWRNMRQDGKAEAGETTMWRLLRAETVEGPAGPLECVDNVECGDGLALRVLGVCYRIPDDLKVAKR